jgi:hypothetical protein
VQFLQTHIARHPSELLFLLFGNWLIIFQPNSNYLRPPLFYLTLIWFMSKMSWLIFTF